MNNIISHINNSCSQSFAVQKIREVDSLIFAQLAYLYFEGFIDPNKHFEKSLWDIGEAENKTNLYEETRTPKKNAQLFQAVLECPRFKDIKIGHYATEFDEKKEKQFSAVTFKIEDNLYYIAYRGTDTSNVGWKEDFNMTFMSSIPAQTAAVEYYRNMKIQYPQARFILGGHSKGGNLAVYAACFACDEDLSFLEAVYNHDGPGFRPDMLELERFNRVKHLIYKTIPQFPFFGFFLEQYENYNIVQSRAFTIFQHDPFSWGVKNGEFILHPEISDFALQVHKTLNLWMDQTDDETKKVFVDAMYDFIPDEESPIENIKYIFNAIKTEDPLVKQTVMDTFALLMSIIVDEVKQSILQKIPNFQSDNPNVTDMPTVSVGTNKPNGIDEANKEDKEKK